MKIDLSGIIIIILAIFLFAGGGYHISRTDDLKDEISQRDKLIIALKDSMRVSTDENGRLVSEKRTLQAEIFDLKDKNLNLSKNQKKLVKEVDQLRKKIDIIVAALIDETLKVDSLTKLIPTNIDTVNKLIVFKDKNEKVSYDMVVNNVLPSDTAKTKRPELVINKLEFPNEKLIEFHWGDRKDGYPVSFSVRNTNPYMQTNDIDSYAIPELQKPDTKPNNWQKIKRWFTRTGDKVLIFVGGVVVGTIGGTIIGANSAGQ
jgi:cell division protein FtsB